MPLPSLLPWFAAVLALAGLAENVLAQGSHVQALNQNGQAKVLYQGRQVWAGPVQGAATVRSRSVNGKEYAAAFDGEKVLWENAPGAAKQVGPPVEPNGFSLQRTLRRNRDAVGENQRQLEEMLEDMDKERDDASPASPGAPPRGGAASGGKAGVTTTTRNNATAKGDTFSMALGTDGKVTRTNGVTTLTWKDKVIPLGRTTGPLSFKSRNVNGSETATLLEGARVLWQSNPGPAQPAK